MDIDKILNDELDTIDKQERQTWYDLKSTINLKNITEIEVLLGTIKILKTRRIFINNLKSTMELEDE